MHLSPGTAEEIERIDGGIPQLGAMLHGAFQFPRRHINLLAVSDSIEFRATRILEMTEVEHSIRWTGPDA